MANTGDLMAVEVRKYLGYPYVWATHGPNSFDCSGLVHWVVLQVTGDYISPGSQVQATLGSLVPAGQANLRPGDLLFFADPIGSSTITHVGIYTGPNEMIHAANESTGVIISDPFAGWYGPRYKFARRLYPYDDNIQEPPPTGGTGYDVGDVIGPTPVMFAAADFASAVIPLLTSSQLCITAESQLVNGVEWIPVTEQASQTDGFIPFPFTILVQADGCEGTPEQPPEEPPPGDTDSRNPSAWTAGDKLRVVDGDLNCRTSYPSGTSLGKYQAGEEMCMVGGPAASSGYTWVQVDGRLDGWVAGEFLERIGIQTCGGTPPPPPPPTWTHKVTGTALNLRSSIGGALITTMPVGTRLRLLSGPTSSGGYTWYNVEAENIGTGWCVNGFDPI